MLILGGSPPAMPLFLSDFLAALSCLRPGLGGLSGRVLALTVGVVVCAEALIVVPTLGRFRTQWFAERVEAAQLASLAVSVADDGGDGMVEISPALRAELLDNAQVLFIRLQRNNVNELVLAGPDVGMADGVVDLAARGGWQEMGEVFARTFSPSPEFIRVRDTPRMDDGQLIEIIVPGAALDREYWRFARRIGLASLIVVLAAGGMVYAALVVMFVQPMRRLAMAMIRFRDAPDDATRVIVPGARSDEIGQAEAALAAMQTDVRQALVERERLASLGRAVAKINHDLRNVLAAAQLMSDRLAAHRDPKVGAQGERLVRAVGRGVRLAEDVLRYGRDNEAEPEPTCVLLRDALEDAFNDGVAVATQMVGLDLCVDAGLVVWADGDHVHRIFVNLIRNGVQAMGGAGGSGLGQVQGQGEAQRQPMITLEGRRVGKDGVVMVRDAGPGVPKRVREHLFEPFGASSRRGGSGLGLSICRELARANGGDVWLEDTGDAGTVFGVRLLVARETCVDVAVSTGRDGDADDAADGEDGA